MSFGGLDLILVTPGSWPERKGGKKKRITGYLSLHFANAFDQQSWNKFLCFCGNYKSSREEARSRAVCSFRNFKAHSSKDVSHYHLKALAVPWMALDFSRGEPYWVGASSRIFLKSAVSQKTCPSWPVLCDYSSKQEWTFYPTGWVRCRAEWGSEAGLTFSASAPLWVWRTVNIRTKLDHLCELEAPLISESVSLLVPGDKCATKRERAQLTNKWQKPSQLCSTVQPIVDYPSGTNKELPSLLIIQVLGVGFAQLISIYSGHKIHNDCPIQNKTQNQIEHKT